MMIRLSKCALLLGVAFFFTLVVFNNVTDYDSNYQFVRHVLSMDSTFNGNRGMWRALPRPLEHKVFYTSIICYEALTGALCWAGLWRLLRARRAAAAVFHNAKQTAVIALTLGCMLWLIAFLDVGAEWFLMWQSKIWNGQEAAFRMFVVLSISLVYLTQPDSELSE